MHSECEGADGGLFEIYKSADAEYTCLSCRQMEDYLVADEICENINNSLLDSDTIRISETEDTLVNPLGSTTHSQPENKKCNSTRNIIFEHR